MKTNDVDTTRQDPASEWDAPVAWSSLGAAGQALVTQDALGGARLAAALTPDVRDRYIADRFPGLARCGEDLQDVSRVIGGARLYFDEGKSDRALELLDLAIQQCPFDEPLRLARLEISFLLRDASLFTALAHEFQRVRGLGLAWNEIARLGRAMAPAEPLFGAKQGDRPFEHYGPWPQMPNWLNASWDLTPDVLAADYHRLMARNAPRYATQSLPSPPRTER